MEIFDAVGVQRLEELGAGEWQVYCRYCVYTSGKNIWTSPYTSCPNCSKPLYVIQGYVFEGELPPITRSLFGRWRIGGGRAIYKSYESALRAWSSRIARDR